jgi:hypothetical protein
MLSNVLLTLLRRQVDAMWNAGNLAFRASLADVAIANTVAPDPAADAMGRRPGFGR